MKLNDIQWNENEYLPANLVESFAESYSLSFPELELNQSSLIAFLNRKYQVIGNSDLHNIATLVTGEGKVASGYGLVRNKYSQGEAALNVGLVCDVFTNTDFRKMGLFKRVSLLAIAREEKTDTNFLIGFPIRDEVMPGHLSVGWRYIFDMPLWWALPRLGRICDVQKNPTFTGKMFMTASKGIAIEPNDTYLKWRFSIFDVEYYLVCIPNSKDFAIVRKAKLKNLPFTCIVFMQSTSKLNSRLLVSRIRNLSLRLGTLGVLGCWNNGYAKDLFLQNSGLRQSSKFQKVIVRELNGFSCPNEEYNYRLSWMDSDTL
ncbi:hypothetical protein MCEMRE191_01407 [Candidatus Nanopelagicaceae bacterium]